MDKQGIKNIIIDYVNEKVILVKKLILVGDEKNIEKIGSTCIWKRDEKNILL